MNCLNVSAACCIDRHGYVADSGGNSFCVRPGEASGPGVCHIPSRQQAPAPGARNVTREPQPLAGSGDQHVSPFCRWHSGAQGGRATRTCLKGGLRVQARAAPSQLWPSRSCGCWSHGDLDEAGVEGSGDARFGRNPCLEYFGMFATT